MPRASGSGKRHSGGAGHRDTKPENGLIGPSKRVSGRKSLNQLDAAARLADQSAGLAAPPLPPGALPNGIPKVHIDAAAATQDNPSSGDGRRSSVGNSSETSTSESCNSHMATNGASLDGGHRQIDVNAMKNADVHRDSGPIDMVASVLKSLPMQDTLAILIILMQLPTLSLSIIYGIFTCLTFVPPVTTSSGINLHFAEIFDGHSTMPSLVTVLCMDFFFLLIWLFLWQPMQDVILDLAKPIIAITLGGGSTSRDGSSGGITTCFAWIVFGHLIRGTKVHWSRLAKHIPEEWHLPPALSSSFEPASISYDKRSPFAWLRSGLAIHILTQGLVKYIREWYLRREKANAAVGQSDPESGKHMPPSLGSGDSIHETGFNTPDTEAGFQPTAPTSTNKKRRKQSTQVRLQQPLWAALASTKIVVMKEYESSHVPSKSLGVNTTDIHNLGNAPFNTQPRQIWISYIGCDEVCFNTSHFPDADDDPLPPAANGHTISRPSGVDTSKPFYVRVNNAFWQPTRIFPVEDSDDIARGGTRWTGDIYGLRPSSKYVCEFVDSRSDKVVFTTSIRTVKEPTPENNSSLPVSGSQPSLQPDSPSTTLKTSIAAAEAKLVDEKNRLKNWRKEWKTRMNTLKKEIELTDNQLSSAGNSDDKLRQKIRQQETQKSQAERDTDGLGDQLKNFDNAPELVESKKAMERSYATEKKLYDAAQKSFREFKSKLECELLAKDTEKNNLNTRRNKIATRIAKVENELANITDANNRGLNEVERRNRERTAWHEQIVEVEHNYNDQVAQLFAANMTRAEQIQSLRAQWNSVQAYMTQSGGLPVDMGSMDAPGPVPFHQQPQPPQQQGLWNANATAPPPFPVAAGMWGTSTAEIHPSMSVQAAPPGVGLWQSPHMASPFEQRVSKSRGRSSSMLSDVSGFTLPSDEETRSPYGIASRRPQYTKFLANGSRRSTGSGGSGGSGSGSGSIYDPASPI